jgi:hypothetical protein
MPPTHTSTHASRLRPLPNPAACLLSGLARCVGGGLVAVVLGGCQFLPIPAMLPDRPMPAHLEPPPGYALSVRRDQDAKYYWVSEPKWRDWQRVRERGEWKTRRISENKPIVRVDRFSANVFMKQCRWESMSLVQYEGGDTPVRPWTFDGSQYEIECAAFEALRADVGGGGDAPPPSNEGGTSSDP